MSNGPEIVSHPPTGPDAFGSENDLVTGALCPPEYDAGKDEEPGVQPQALPERRPGLVDRDALGCDGQAGRRKSRWQKD